VPGWAKIKGDESKIKTRIMTGILIVALVVVSVGVAAAQYGQGDAGGARYMDADGNGVCDNIGINGKDSDGDGIPNGRDDDHAPSRDGRGRGNGGQGHGHNR